MGGLCKEVLRGEADAPEAECEQRSRVRRKRPSAAVRYSGWRRGVLLCPG